MTKAKKIHLQDPEEPAGTGYCGRKRPAPQVVTDPDLITCDVCMTVAARRGGATVLDRLASTRPPADLSRFTPAPAPVTRGVDALEDAEDRAYKALAARHMDEFLELYRHELTTELGR